jgi:DNA-binding NarL/FixJ family response regulator
MTVQTLTAVVVDDHPLVIDGVTRVLRGTFEDLNVVYGGASINEAIQAIRGQHVDFVITDLDLGGGTTHVDLVSRLCAEGRPVVVMSAWDSSDSISTALTCGAYAFVSKRAEFADLITAVSFALKGERWMNHDVAEILAGDMGVVVLTEQERRALTLYASGLTLDTVSRRMGISPNTVKYYLNRARDKFAKIGVNARTKVALHEAAKAQGFI